jgi:hypothetical protein
MSNPERDPLISLESIFRQEERVVVKMRRSMFDFFEPLNERWTKWRSNRS